jgi:hypothetical protein
MRLSQALNAAEQEVLQIIGDRARPPVSWDQVKTAYWLKDPPPSGYGFDPSTINNIFAAINGYLGRLPWPDRLSRPEFDKAQTVGDLLSIVYKHIHH